MSEPMPEATANTRRDSSIDNDVAEIAPDERRARARKLVERFSLWSGAAGLLPVPIVDLAAVGGVQIQMLRRISQIYDVPFSKNRGKALIAGLAGTMIASTGLGMASIIKSVPIAGTAIGAITTPALSIGATYVIGMAFIEHFASGGTLLDFDPPDHREFIKAEMAVAQDLSHAVDHGLCVCRYKPADAPYYLVGLFCLRLGCFFGVPPPEGRECRHAVFRQRIGTAEAVPARGPQLAIGPLRNDVLIPKKMRSSALVAATRSSRVLGRNDLCRSSHRPPGFLIPRMLSDPG